MYFQGGLWIPNDFMVDPVPLALTFAKLAIAKGKNKGYYSTNLIVYF